MKHSFPYNRKSIASLTAIEPGWEEEEEKEEKEKHQGRTDHDISRRCLLFS